MLLTSMWIRFPLVKTEMWFKTGDIIVLLYNWCHWKICE